MNILRARQIVESPQEIEVHHNGVPVWIQNLDESRETARVYTRNQPDDEKTVPVEELREIGPKRG
ncbi:small acid-soluble spore protein H (minor) [Melghirimyces profundicolus]|uniref:Small acid-soluble spore protein H (Minor) n=1 Tax=Melghirimyces profundicolus TaxID=1242148 RepID=A0A2T6B838_9BACL|nr:H-type small acid-soluble spore protein [Melghirimyces profundicolus]PTX52192.1 small acid-soluble spore protein H (minor) [Melghirimyces profundicolus]